MVRGFHVWCFVMLLAGSILVTNDSRAADFVMTTGAKEPYSNKEQTGYLDQVARAVFGYLGHKVVVRALPAARSLNEASLGHSDGDMQRIAGLSKRHPTLLQVPEKISDYKFAGFSRIKGQSLSSWQDLKNRRPGYILGWKYFENRMPEGVESTGVASPEPLFRLLEARRADIVLFSLYSGNWWSRQLNITAWPVEGPFDSLDMFMYVHERNRDLVMPLAKALALLKEQGVIDRIRHETLPGYRDLHTN